MQYIGALMRQKYFYIGIFLATLAIAITGIITLLYSPYLGMGFVSQNDRWYIASVDKNGPAKEYTGLIGQEIISVAEWKVEKDDLAKEWDDIGGQQDFYRFMQVQKYFSTNIREGSPVSITLKDKRNRTQTINITPADYPVLDVVTKAGVMFVIAAITLLIGIIVILKRIDDVRARIFFFLTIWGSIVEITLGTFVARDISFDFNIFVFLDVFNNLALFYGSAALFHFATIFPETKPFTKNNIVIPLLYITALVVTILYGTRLFYYSYQAFLLFCMIGGIIAIIHSYISIKSPALKAQAKTVLLGTSISLGIFPIFYFGPMLLTGHRLISGYIPVAFTLLVPLSMAFAIMKYKLMDIDTLFDNTVVYMLTLGILAIIDVSLIGTLINTKILNFNISTPVATTIAVWLVVLVYIPVRNQIQKWIKYLMNKEIYDIHNVSLELNRELLSAGNIESAFEKTMNVLKKTLRPKGGYALLLNEKGSVIMWNDAYPIDLPINIESIKDSTHPISLFSASGTNPLPHDYSGGVLVPIVGSLGHLGYLILQNKESDKLYDKEDFKLLNMIATQIAMAMEAISSRDKVVQKEKEAVIEKERISREIHDGIGNDLAQALILSNAAKSNTKYINDLQKILSESLTSLRELIWTVEAGSSTLADMATYISDKVQYLQNTGNIHLDINVSLEHEQLEVSSIIKLNILRIIQESVTNTIKYAEASSIHITLEQHEDKLKLEIRDNGKGFDMEKISEGSYGLRNIQKRCKEIGAKLNILSQPGQGTQISVGLSL